MKTVEKSLDENRLIENLEGSKVYIDNIIEFAKEKGKEHAKILVTLYNSTTETIISEDNLVFSMDGDTLILQNYI